MDFEERTVNLTSLYSKVPVAKHPNITVKGDEIVYYDGTNHFRAWIRPDGNIVPLDNQTRAVLKVLAPTEY
mgnify:CR=1 FL=1